MNINEISIKNTCNESEIIRFILKFYCGAFAKGLLLLWIGWLLYSLFVAEGAIYFIMNALVSLAPLLTAYICTRLTTKKLILKCSVFTITNSEITIDGIKLESIDKIIILDNFILICYFKSYILINAHEIDLKNLIALINLNNIETLINPKRFSLIKLAYSSK